MRFKISASAQNTQGEEIQVASTSTNDQINTSLALESYSMANANDKINKP